MKFHHKIKTLRQINCYSYDFVGKYMNMTGSAYGNIERGDTQASHQQVNQLAALYDKNAYSLTNDEDFHLHLSETDKGKIEVRIETEGNKLTERNTQLEEENKRLRDFNDDLKYVNTKQKEIIDSYEKPRKKRVR